MCISVGSSSGSPATHPLSPSSPPREDQQPPLELESSGKVSCSSAWFLTMPCPSLPTGVGTQPQLLAGQGAWHRAGCTGALAAMPAEGLGELSRLHIHSRVC